MVKWGSTSATLCLKKGRMDRSYRHRTIWHHEGKQTIWHQDKKMENLAQQLFGSFLSKLSPKKCPSHFICQTLLERPVKSTFFS